MWLSVLLEHMVGVLCQWLDHVAGEVMYTAQENV